MVITKSQATFRAMALHYWVAYKPYQATPFRVNSTRATIVCQLKRSVWLDLAYNLCWCAGRKDFGQNFRNSTLHADFFELNLNLNCREPFSCLPPEDGLFLEVIYAQGAAKSCSAIFRPVLAQYYSARVLATPPKIIALLYLIVYIHK